MTASFPPVNIVHVNASTDSVLALAFTKCEMVSVFGFASAPLDQPGELGQHRLDRIAGSVQRVGDAAGVGCVGLHDGLEPAIEL